MKVVEDLRQQVFKLPDLSRTVVIKKRELQNPDLTFLVPSQSKGFQELESYVRAEDTTILMFLLTGNAGSGKLQPLTEPILTPKGWVTMGDIKAGSEVTCPITGEGVRVESVYPQKDLKIYKVGFSDGTYTECCNDHLFQVQTKKDITKGISRVLPVQQMLDIGLKHNGRVGYRFSIPLTQPVKFRGEDNRLPLDPYFLGVLLGDGYIPIKYAVTIACDKDKVLGFYNTLKEVVPKDVKLTIAKGYDNTRTVHIRVNAKVKPYLKNLGLLGKKSRVKFIPRIYLQSSIENRKKILAGLLDTDGSFADFPTKKKIGYSTMSERLKDDVLELIRGLGGHATVSSETRPKYNGGTCWNISLRTKFNPFNLRVSNGVFFKHSTIFGWRKQIKSIEYLRQDRGQCIKVDSPQHLYITRDYTVTHNTTLVSTFIEWLLFNKPTGQIRIAMTAPTNKAVKVLRNMAEYDHGNLSYSTIHSLLGLKHKINFKTGKEEFTRDWDEPSRIETIDVLVLDEVSQLNDELMDFIYPYVAMGLKIIFVGDAAQIPPVGKTQSKPLKRKWREENRVGHYNLSQIIRQAADNPIIKASIKVREDLWQDKLAIKNDIIDSGGIYNLYRDDKLGNSELLNHYFTSPNFKQNPDFCKVGAWTNRTVNSYNKLIRGMIFGENQPKMVIGDLLLADSPIMDGEEIIFSTNTEFEVIEIKYEVRELQGLQLQFYILRVRTNEGKTKWINVIHEVSEASYKKLLKKIVDTAKSSKGKTRTDAWRMYWTLKKHFADVKYNYALTIHKMQGSTYDNVFIATGDIDHNPNLVERNRIKYTAITRPKNYLFIIN